jgi:hypothetical protein
MESPVVGAWGAPNNQRHRNLTPNREPLRTVAHVVLICSLCDNAIPAKDHHSRRRACALSFWRIEERRKPLSLRFFPRPPGYIRLTPAFAPTPSSSARALKRSRHRKCLFLLPPSTPSWQLPSPTTTFLHPRADMSMTSSPTCPLCGQPLPSPPQRLPRVLRVVLRVASTAGPSRHATLLISMLVTMAIHTSDYSLATPAA